MQKEPAYSYCAACYVGRGFTAGDPVLPISEPAGSSSDSAPEQGWGSKKWVVLCQSSCSFPAVPDRYESGDLRPETRPGRTPAPRSPSAASRDPVVHAYQCYHIVGYDARKKCWVPVAYYIRKAL